MTKRKTKLLSSKPQPRKKFKSKTQRNGDNATVDVASTSVGKSQRSIWRSLGEILGLAFLIWVSVLVVVQTARISNDFESERPIEGVFLWIDVAAAGVRSTSIFSLMGIFAAIVIAQYVDIQSASRLQVDANRVKLIIAHQWIARGMALVTIFCVVTLFINSPSTGAAETTLVASACFAVLFMALLTIQTRYALLNPKALREQIRIERGHLENYGFSGGRVTDKEKSQVKLRGGLAAIFTILICLLPIGGIVLFNYSRGADLFNGYVLASTVIVVIVCTFIPAFSYSLMSLRDSAPRFGRIAQWIVIALYIIYSMKSLYTSEAANNLTSLLMMFGVTLAFTIPLVATFAQYRVSGLLGYFASPARAFLIISTVSRINATESDLKSISQPLHH